jgi:hypothetical protein
VKERKKKEKGCRMDWHQLNALSSGFCSGFSFSANPARDDGIKPMMKRNGIMGEQQKMHEPRKGVAEERVLCQTLFN